MIQEWFESGAENRQQKKQLYVDITEEEENILSAHIDPKRRTYHAYHGRYLEYIPNPEQMNITGFTKIKEEYRGEILVFDGRAIDEVGYMESIFEFDFYWHPRLNWGVMSTKGGRFTKMIYDRFDCEESLFYDSAIKGFFHKDAIPVYTIDLITSQH